MLTGHHSSLAPSHPIHVTPCACTRNATAATEAANLRDIYPPQAGPKNNGSHPLNHPSTNHMHAAAMRQTSHSANTSPMIRPHEIDRSRQVSGIPAPQPPVQDRQRGAERAGWNMRPDEIHHARILRRNPHATDPQSAQLATMLLRRLRAPEIVR